MYVCSTSSTRYVRTYITTPICLNCIHKVSRVVLNNLEGALTLIDSDYGTIKIKLDELLEISGLSKNKLAHRAEMQRSQLNAYCNNTITRLDIAVLARLCTVLECRIEDLLEFIPSNNNK